MKAFISGTVLTLFFLATSSAFTVAPQSRLVSHSVAFSPVRSLNSHKKTFESEASFDPLNLANQKQEVGASRRAVASAAFLAVLTGLPGVSSADGPDWGIFEGKTASLLHPLVMGSMFLFQVNTAIKGFNWRRQRTIGDDIAALKKQLPALPEGAATLNQAIDMGTEAGTDVSAYKAALEIESQISALTAERKELSTQNNRDTHYNQGAILAFIGTLFAIEGPLNTYARAGKLFPGPHLYSGAGLVVCWAAAAACVPFMQKGNSTARSLHISANVIGMSLFAWQVQSGIPILTKVWELTKWP